MLCLSGFELYSRWVPLFLVGDLVFKLNSGPEDKSNVCALCSHSTQKHLHLCDQEIVVNCLPLVRDCKRQLSFSLMNLRLRL